MSDKTEIGWTNATFNPWWGCTKVSPACDHCYAERDAKRFAPQRVLWGHGSERRTFGDAHWAGPLVWDTRAANEGRRIRVFCASMADVFDTDAPEGARERLWSLIEATPNLEWQLLTKRIGNVQRMVPASWATSWPEHVELGITIVNQMEADRDVQKLIDVRGNIPVRFVSIEPMLGPMRLHPMWLHSAGISWVIAGGESGPHARPAHPDWFRSLRDQCADANVPFFFKQWGEWAPGECAESSPTRTERTATWWDGKWDFGSISPREGEEMHRDDEPDLYRLGKKASGRMLDGRTHDGFPQ